jgi:hypothetical protein
MSNLNREAWTQVLVENTFPDNDFINYSVDHSQYVNYMSVHVPNVGAIPNVTVDRTVFPGTITQRQDFDLQYNLHEYSTDPQHVQYSEQAEISYDKMASILSNMTNQLKTAIGNRTAYDWSPQAVVSGVTRVVRTTGAASTACLASGATGSRSAVTLSDIARVKSILAADKMPDDGNQFLLFPSTIYWNQLLQISEVIEMFKYGKAVLPSGVLNELYNFNIMIRPDVSVYLTGATPVLQTIDGNGNVVATNTTDNLAILAWHKNAVSSAKGEMKIFFAGDRPEYYGDISSALIRYGSAKIRRDGKGTCAIVQQ